MSLDGIIYEVDHMAKSLRGSALRDFNAEIYKILLASEQVPIEYSAKLISDRLTTSGNDAIDETIEVLCRYRSPRGDREYYSAEVVNGLYLDCYSVSIFREGKQVRVPRAISGVDADNFRLRHEVKYVIESADEAKHWILKWQARALISGRILHHLIEDYC